MATKKFGVAVDGYSAEAFDRIYGDAFAKEATVPERNGMREAGSRQPLNNQPINDDVVRHCFDAVIKKVEDLLLEQQDSAERLKTEYAGMLAGFNCVLVACERMLSVIRVHPAAGRGGQTGGFNGVKSAVSDDVVAIASVVHGPGAKSKSRVAQPVTNHLSDARLAQLTQAIANGQVKLTVAGIRRYLGCSQATASELRRKLLALRASDFQPAEEV